MQVSVDYEGVDGVGWLSVYAVIETGQSQVLASDEKTIKRPAGNETFTLSFVVPTNDTVRIIASLQAESIALTSDHYRIASLKLVQSESPGALGDADLPTVDKMVDTFVEAIRSKSVEQLLRATHPEVLANISKSERRRLERYLSLYFYHDIPGHYSAEVIRSPDHTSRPRRVGEKRWAVAPEIQVKIKYPTGRGITRIVPVSMARKNGSWWFVWPSMTASADGVAL